MADTTTPTAGPDDDLVLGLLGHLNYAEYCREITRWSGAGGLIHEAGGVVCFATASTFPVLFNGAFRLDDRVEPSTVVDMADAFFADRGTGYTILLRDLPADAALEAECEVVGMHRILDSPEMVVTAPVDAPPLPANATLEWVVDEAGVADFVAVSDAAYESLGLPAGTTTDAIADPAAMLRPHIQSVVARLDGQAVAAALTVLSHGIAGVYWVGTLEAARGTGLGAAVAAAVTNRAFDLGAVANTLQASVMGEAIYTRMGYRTLYRHHGWVRFEAPSVGSEG